MTANSINPETIRDYLVTLLETALEGTGKPLGANHAIGQVLNHWEGTISPRLTAVMVMGAGDEPTMTRMDGSSLDTWIYLEVQTWVIYSDDKASPAWTIANAEDKLNLIKKTIKDVVVDNRGKGQNASVPWDFMTFNGRSSVGDVLDDGGTPYIIEMTPLKARVMYG
jgi:hypothetical protein